MSLRAHYLLSEKQYVVIRAASIAQLDGCPLYFASKKELTAALQRKGYHLHDDMRIKARR